MSSVPTLTALNLSDNGNDLCGGDLGNRDGSLRALTHLSLSGCQRVSDDGLRGVSASFPAITFLDLHDCSNVTSKGLQWVARLTALTSLDLSVSYDDYNYETCGSEDDGVRMLRPLTGLRLLDLSFTKVTNKGMKDVGSLSALTSLKLFGTDVTAKGLRDLTELSALTYLDLGETLVEYAPSNHQGKLRGLTALTHINWSLAERDRPYYESEEYSEEEEEEEDDEVDEAMEEERRIEECATDVIKHFPPTSELVCGGFSR